MPSSWEGKDLRVGISDLSLSLCIFLFVAREHDACWAGDGLV